MPQMAPLMWLPLMLTFSALLIITMIMMFFFSPVFKETASEMPMGTSNLNTKKLSWTW